MQVRNLERFFGKKLFVCSNNRITITDAGMAVYHGTATALGGIAAITESLLDGDRKANLVLSVVTSLAERWLVPRLASFLPDGARSGIEIRVENDPVDFAANGIDIRITYGRHHYPDFQEQKLFTDAVTPMLAAEFPVRVDSIECFGQIPDSQLIHVDWGEHFASQPSWADWFKRVGIPRNPGISKGKKVATSSIAIAVAEKGLGVALGQKTLAGAELESGTVVSPFSQAVKLAHPY